MISNAIPNESNTPKREWVSLILYDSPKKTGKDGTCCHTTGDCR